MNGKKKHDFISRFGVQSCTKAKHVACRRIDEGFKFVDYF